MDLYHNFKIKYFYSYLDNEDVTRIKEIDFDKYLEGKDKSTGKDTEVKLIKRLLSAKNPADCKRIMEAYLSIFAGKKEDDGFEYESKILYKELKVYGKLLKVAYLLSSPENDDISSWAMMDAINSIVLSDCTDKLLPVEGNRFRVTEKNKADIYWGSYVEEYSKCLYGDELHSDMKKLNTVYGELMSALVACYVWKSIDYGFGGELTDKFGYESQTYNGTRSSVSYWSNKRSDYRLTDLYNQGLNEVNKNIGKVGEHYLSNMALKCAEGDFLLNKIIKTSSYVMETSSYKIKRFENKFAMIEGLSKKKYLKRCLINLIEYILHEKIKNVEINVDIKSKTVYFNVKSVIEALYVYLMSILVRPVEYRKCELCDTFFVSSQPGRKYCDYHKDKKRYQYHNDKIAEKSDNDDDFKMIEVMGLRNINDLYDDDEDDEDDEYDEFEEYDKEDQITFW